MPDGSITVLTDDEVHGSSGDRLFLDYGVEATWLRS